MPDMKNCIFADVILLMEHTGKIQIKFWRGNKSSLMITTNCV